MESGHLNLDHVVIKNFKSLRAVEMRFVNNLTLFMGRNNAGKSNILDCFNFLVAASESLDAALATRGGSLLEIIHKKKEGQSIEVAFDFSLPSDKRAGFLAALLADNKELTPEAAAATTLLSTLTLKVVINRESVMEELSTTNLTRDARPCLIFQQRMTAQKVETISGQLDHLCAQARSEIPSETKVIEDSTNPSHTLRLCLGCPVTPGLGPVSQSLSDRVHAQFASLQWLDPHRDLLVQTPIHGEVMLAPDASNLPDVLHWLYNNKPKQFQKVEAEVGKLIPNLGKLYTPTAQNTTTIGVIEPGEDDLSYNMSQMSFGTKSAIAIVTKVAVAEPGSWLSIEEPETYLHPRAQLALFQFLRNESASKRIFIATHSTGIAAGCPIESLFIVRREADGCTSVSSVTEPEVIPVIEQLGIKPSFSFEADAIVFLEEPDHVPVYEAWARKFLFHVQTQFLDVEGAATLHFYANARVARSKYVHTEVFAIFDGSAPATRERFLKHLPLPPDQALTLVPNEIEGYLLDAPAILKAFPGIGLSEAALVGRFDLARNAGRQKAELQALCRELKLPGYDGAIGARIAEAMEQIPPKLKELFQKIDERLKPHWKI